MSLPGMPQKEEDKKIYLLIKEGRMMTAAELRERTGYSKGQVHSSLMKLYHNGYIIIAKRDTKKGCMWKVN